MNFPLISVIIPAHNNENTISVAIESISNQTYPNLEIIVIDDNSTDNTEIVVLELMGKHKNLSYYTDQFNDPNRLNKYGRNINAGYSARNCGFEKVRGEWITFQDADDASLLNRIEVQYGLAKKYNATHICVDWQKLEGTLLNKKLDVNKILEEQNNVIIQPEEIIALAKKTKGLIIPLLGPINKLIPFECKRWRIINKLFFGSLAPYPGTGNSPLFKKEVLEKVKFRKLSERIWPSFVGRGADRDFNFQVAETFKNSYTFFIPLYLWRQEAQNNRYNKYEQYLY